MGSRQANAPVDGRLGTAVVSHLPAREKLKRLLQVARGKRRGLILTHDNPDPDSLAAAVALAFLLERKARIMCRVAFGGIIGRAENIAFVKVLRLPVAPVSHVVFDDYDLLGLVDTQQGIANHSLPARYRADIVVDHHPPRTEGLSAPFADVGGTYGATSTLLVEYLRAARLEPSVDVATALYYGIKADTRDLGRETTPSDVDSYLWLFPRIDKELLNRIEHPELPARYFRLYHAAIERAKIYDSIILTNLGEVYSPDMVAEVAERMMALEDMRCSIAFATFRNQLYISMRVKDQRLNAGRIIRQICDPRGGSAGGHGSMAGARLPLKGTRRQRDVLQREIARAFLEAFGVAQTRGTSLLAWAEP